MFSQSKYIWLNYNLFYKLGFIPSQLRQTNIGQPNPTWCTWVCEGCRRVSAVLLCSATGLDTGAGDHGALPFLPGCCCPQQARVGDAGCDPARVPWAVWGGSSSAALQAGPAQTCLQSTSIREYVLCKRGPAEIVMTAWISPGRDQNKLELVTVGRGRQNSVSNKEKVSPGHIELFSSLYKCTWRWDGEMY